jgi:hypothetical protein
MRRRAREGSIILFLQDKVIDPASYSGSRLPLESGHVEVSRTLISLKTSNREPDSLVLTAACTASGFWRRRIVSGGAARLCAEERRSHTSLAKVGRISRAGVVLIRSRSLRSTYFVSTLRLHRSDVVTIIERGIEYFVSTLQSSDLFLQGKLESNKTLAD